jgi:hypothetical protein
MASARITRKRIDELLRFLPALGTPGPDTEPTWHGLDKKPANGMFVMPYPTYQPVVEEFFTLAAQEWWCDYRYDPEEAAELVQDDAAIASASLARLRTMLTFCVRGERFCDGHWGRWSGRAGSGRSSAGSNSCGRQSSSPAPTGQNQPGWGRTPQTGQSGRRRVR